MSFFLVFLLIPFITARSLPLDESLLENVETHGLVRRHNGATVANFDGFHLNSSSERSLSDSLDLSLPTPANGRSDSKSKVDARQSTRLIARKNDDVEKCLRKSGVKTFYTHMGDNGKNSQKYSDYVQSALNPSFPGYPGVIVIASTIKEVQRTVSCAAAAKLPVQPRAGGHSWAGYSLGYSGDKTRVGNQVIIDIQALNKIEYDKNDDTITVGGGVQLGPLALALLDKGRAISHGDCPGVGIAGHALHGGVGWTSRMWGVSTDFIIGLTVVNADGQLQHLSDTENPELFWAMKGAGSSFAVAVSLELKTAPAPEQVTGFQLSVYGLTPSLAAQFFDEIQTCVQSSDFDQYLGLAVSASWEASGEVKRGIGFGFKGYYFGPKGSESHVGRVITPCFERIGSPRILLTTYDYKEYLTAEAKPLPLEKPKGGFRTTSLPKNLAAITLPENYPPTKAMMKKFFSALVITPQAVKVSFRLMGGTDSRIPFEAQSTALSYRNSLWSAELFSLSEGFGDSIERLRRTLIYDTDDQTDEQANYALTTFIDGNLERDEAQKRYFSKETLARLQEIKTANDPENVFRNPQSIEPQSEQGDDSATLSQ